MGEDGSREIARSEGKAVLELVGAAARATVMLDEIDEMTKSQLEAILDSPAFAGSRIVVMPDCHAGKGAVIGFTMTMGLFVIPNIVGVDIGCGMLAARLGPEASARFDPAAFDAFVKREIPAGFEVHGSRPRGLDPDFLERVDREAARVGADRARAERSLGTLGGGNHFIEVDRDSSGLLWVVVHSGSRNFGKCVAESYQDRARAYCAGLRGERPRRDLEYLPLDHPEARSYLEAMRLAQDYARRNRELMMGRLLDFLGGGAGAGREGEGGLPPAIESVHNYIDFDDRILRKGAIAAREGQVCFIPFNMRDGSAICRGKGSVDFNLSAPHGAGRALSRHEAKRRLGLDAFSRSLKEAGVFTTTATASTLDEAPEAYKSDSLILGSIGGTVEVLDLLKPVYNFKASGD